MKSVSNRQMTLLRKLGQKKYRQQERLFIVEGERAVEQVLENGQLTIRHLFFDEIQNLWEDPGWNQKIQHLPGATIGGNGFRDITDTENPQGVLALCEIPAESSLEQFSETEGVLAAVARIQDPGNLGTIVRTGTWFGLQGLLLGNGTVDLYHPKVVRSTAGSTGAIPYLNSGLQADLDYLEERGWEVLLLDAGPDSTPLKEIQPSGKTVIVIGNEANGISKKLFKPGRTVARIESAGGRKGVESLNASIAFAIGLHALT